MSVTVGQDLFWELTIRGGRLLGIVAEHFP
jgi:hypothetical protein